MTEPDQEKTRQRAYEIYQQRQQQGTEGDELADWYEAENEGQDQSADDKPAPK